MGLTANRPPLDSSSFPRGGSQKSLFSGSVHAGWVGRRISRMRARTHAWGNQWARLQICGIFTEELLKNSALLDFFARTEFSTSNQVGDGWVVGELRISRDKVF